MVKTIDDAQEFIDELTDQIREEGWPEAVVILVVPNEETWTTIHLTGDRESELHLTIRALKQALVLIEEKLSGGSHAHRIH